jgi:hypothetical protein
MFNDKSRKFSSIFVRKCFAVYKAQCYNNIHLQLRTNVSQHGILMNLTLVAYAGWPTMRKLERVGLYGSHNI